MSTEKNNHPLMRCWRLSQWVIAVMTTEQSLPWHYERRIEESKWGDGIPREIDYFTRDDGVEISGNETPIGSWFFTYRRGDIALGFHANDPYVPSSLSLNSERDQWRYARGLGPRCSVSPDIWRLPRPLADAEAKLVADDIRDFLIHFHELGVLTATPIRQVR